jgi:ribose transport system substrate-binding protein
MHFLPTARTATRASRSVVLLSTLIAMALLAGCASSTTTGGSGKTVSYTPPNSGCGSFHAAPPQDPDGVLPTLPKDIQRDFAGEPQILKSAWANWKPTHAPPYSVTVIMSGAVNQLQTHLIADLKSQLAASKDIGKVNLLLTNGVDIPAQIEQMETAIRNKTDIILLEPLQAAAFLQPVAQAGKAGIPTVTFLSLVNSPYALNVNINAYLSAAVSASFIARQAGGTGTVLNVAGYGVGQTDVLTEEAAKDVIASCPGMTFGGTVLGAYSNGLAKGETLQFLATHPGKIAGVVQGGTMAQGIISAFTSSGRPVPPVSAIAAVEGSLAYWRDHRKTYHGIGTGPGPASLARATVSVMQRTLAGQGPLVNKFFGPLPLITDQNLDQWVSPSAKESSLAAAEGPPDAFLPESYLNRLFAHGNVAK